MTDYTIKAIPTRYRDIEFRSRLEATWAAYFDLCDIPWEYEPFDLEGWAPDFLLRHEEHEILAEVKPAHNPANELDAYRKALNHSRSAWVLLLGRAPNFIAAGHLLDHPKMWTAALPQDPWFDFHIRLSPANTMRLWAEATNITRWKGPRS